MSDFMVDTSYSFYSCHDLTLMTSGILTNIAVNKCKEISKYLFSSGITPNPIAFLPAKSSSAVTRLASLCGQIPCNLTWKYFCCMVKDKSSVTKTVIAFHCWTSCS